MGLMDQTRLDIQSIRGNLNDFGVTLILTAPTSPATVLTTVGTVKKHHTTMSELGLPTRTKGNTIMASCTVPTLSLDAADYPYRNSDNRVTFKDHLVQWTDISGSWTYRIVEWLPNEGTGEIVLILGYYD